MVGVVLCGKDEGLKNKVQKTKIKCGAMLVVEGH
jgi:hypothetical protein